MSNNDLRSCVQNCEGALNVAISLAVPAPVVGWIHRVQWIAVTVRHFGCSRKVYCNGTTVVQRRIAARGVVRITARHQVQAVGRGPRLSDVDGGWNRAWQRH